MKFTLSLIICLTTLFCYSQSFEEFIQQADSLYDVEEYLESGLKYNEAFKLKEGTSGQYYNAACSWALTGDTSQSISFLELSAEKGWISLKHIKSDSDLLSLHQLKAWDGIIENVQANLDEYEKDFDRVLKEQLEQIYVRDQTLRQLYQNAEDKFGRDSEEMTYFWELVSQQDSINELEVIDILNKKGWIGKSLVGGQANMTIWLVIQHASIDIQEKYLPMMKQSVLEGESSGRHLALLEDRIQMRNGKPQIYGSQITRDEVSGEQIIYKILEPEYVNQRRNEVGLGPLEDYVKQWGLKWTVEQKEK